ncbi:hypothetical protein ASE86_11865 [Sphingomonas sp. Leaf33]|uniref:MFS transporter n=1 Tax=Sphingomonas sp. Leaf33 TaxID=1736215 RepID=UPI0006F3D7BD|nr:MFS transporter [Sphingomonas sp. Leaf33]KQN19215.1 hypothetical protein ASE86_11865 [Sphingomonas sp. Leaf33]
MRRSARFLAGYALASAGGVLAYLPLLSLLLPLRMGQVAADASIDYLTLAAILGAIAASVANIAFGWASDRSVARGRSRRGWVALGVASLLPAYVALAWADTPAALVAAVIGVQVAVNVLLAPLLAIMADEIPDAQKGLASGLLTLGPPIGSAFAALLVSLPLPSIAARFACIPVAVALCVVPFLLTRAGPPLPTAETPPDADVARRDLVIAWIARLLVQIAGAVVGLYLLYYFQSIAPQASTDRGAAGVGVLMAVAALIVIPVAIGVGRLSDRTRRRRAILCGSAAVAAAGLLAMAVARDWTTGAIGYGMYAVGTGVFLALHAGFAMQLLPSPRHRGRDLGIINLTNTAPAVIGPALAWTLATTRDFSVALGALAVLTLAGGATVLAVRGRR